VNKRRNKPTVTQSDASRAGPAVVVFLLGTSFTALCLQSVLQYADVAALLMSRSLWVTLASKLGAGRNAIAQGEFGIGYGLVWLMTAGAAAVLLIAGSLLVGRLSKKTIGTVMFAFAFRGWLWWLLPGGWEVLRVTASLLNQSALLGFLHGTFPLWLALTLAGCLAELLLLATRPALPSASRPSPDRPSLEHVPSARWGPLMALGLMCLLYVAAFVWMNWQLYFGLHVPHGDSAMYEEHLWNVTHGKGFRSYLDDGRLFLGEHVQVVHLLLAPLYWLWPSHLLLELCESLALACGAIPVYWMTRRHSGSARWAVLLAGAYLLYLPLHFLDVSIDVKTFRPTSFGVPAMLFALDQMERRRFKTMLVFLLLGLSAKEDYAVILSCVGLWMLCSPRCGNGDNSGQPKSTGSQSSAVFTILSRRRWWGLGLTVFGAVYLLLVIQLVIPVFRGDVPHYARYFGELGNTPGDVVRSVFSQPGVVAGKLFSWRSVAYALLLLLPVGFLPLRSPGRLAVALPWFAVLCLLELTSDPARQGTEMLVPGHHFHAPLIPVLFWAAAAGQHAESRKRKPESGTAEAGTGPGRMPRILHPGFAFTAALFSGALLSFHPLSLAFWDAGSPTYWKTRYVPGKRAELFPIVKELVPHDARVFSTDFVHTRFTHYKRSYDYSAYRRKSDEELTNPVPGETYYIVIDTQSRYSTIRTPQDVPEYRNHPEDWELLRHPAEEYFIVLRRR